MPFIESVLTTKEKIIYLLIGIIIALIILGSIWYFLR